MASPPEVPDPPDALEALDADPDVDMIEPPPNPVSSDTIAPADPSEKEERNENLEDLALEEPRVPLRKDISLREFLGRMDEYAPIIPDAVTFHALTLAGLPPPPTTATTSSSGASTSSPHTPLHLSRLLALATQKFVADIAADAYQYSRMRSGTMTSNSLGAGPGMVAGAAGVGPGLAASAPSGSMPGVAGPGMTAAGGGAGAAGGPGTSKGSTATHVLGAQRPGFGGGGQGGGQGRAVLTMEDLGMAVGEYGVNVRRGEFYR